MGGWVMEGLMHDGLDDGKTIQCVGCCSEDWESEGRRKALVREKARVSFATWLDGSITMGMIDGGH